MKIEDIKFRGMNTKGEMVFGSLVVTTSFIPHMSKAHTKTWIVEESFGNGGWFNVKKRQYVKPETVGQFTGLKNRDGEEVYDGDFIMCPSWNKPNPVFWDKTGFLCFIPQLDDYSMAFLSGYGDFKIVGNIHQNPELLDGDEDGI